jgi:hypothetical protein
LLGAGRREPCAGQVESLSTEDRAASEAAHCWGVRMSFNTSSHKISGLRSPVLVSAMSFVAIVFGGRG